MKLLLITLFLVFFAFAAQYFNRYFKIFLIAAIFIVPCVYYIFTALIFYPDNFKPMQKIQLRYVLENYYNLIVESFQNNRLDIEAKRDYSVLKTTDVYKNFPSYLLADINLLRWVLDLSYYKEKFYFYFGITPVLLFYLPFNIITGFYLTDRMLLLFLAVGIFLLSLSIVNRMLREMNAKIPPFIRVLFVFIIGFSNGIFFLLIRPSTYEISIACAAFMFLLAAFLFSKYLFGRKNSLFLLALAGFIIALSVGARPFYVLAVPLFIAAVCYDGYINNINRNEIIKRLLLFVVACAAYGTLLALYNYLRFDSIFKFGMRYQLNDMNFNEWSFSFKDLFVGLSNYIFSSPLITDSFPFIALNYSSYHRLAKELTMGIIFLFPMVLFLGLTPRFLNDLFVKKEIRIFICLLCAVFFINLITVSTAGMAHRYIFELMYILAIAAPVIFSYLYSLTNEKRDKKFLSVLFCCIFFITIYVNISAVISAPIAKHAIAIDNNVHKQVREFLL